METGSTETSDDYDVPDRLEGSQLKHEVLARWKHAVLTAAVGATAYVLYVIGEGWTLDATVFAVAAVAILAYSLVTLRSDLD